jgi:hypothetical protein
MLLVQNVSGAPVDGPLYLVLDGLTKGVQLRNMAGITQTHVRPGDPYVLLPVWQLDAGQGVLLNLSFSSPRLRPVSFNTFVLAGPGAL